MTKQADNTAEHAAIVPRENLDFGLDGDIPKYWMGGDPFKTRFFDAMSTLFPQGEKFFIMSVREFRDQIKDPKLLQEVKDFTRQEAQHSIVHNRYNERLQAQGVDIADISKRLEEDLFGEANAKLTATQRLAITAALEHLTSMMCTCFFERRDLLEECDPRIRAVYAWHAIEEVEHKAVAFDVLTKVAKANWFQRNIPMLLITFGFPFTVARIMHHMFQVDGFSRGQQVKMWLKGLWWWYKPGGLFMPTLGYYSSYYKPGFHPWKLKEMPSYGTWMEVFERTKDPIAAGNALHAAGR
jgi:uncharacterized protein